MVTTVIQQGDVVVIQAGARPYIDFDWEDPTNVGATSLRARVVVKDPDGAESMYEYNNAAMSNPSTNKWRFRFPLPFENEDEGTWIVTCVSYLGIEGSKVTQCRVEASAFTTDLTP